MKWLIPIILFCSSVSWGAIALDNYDAGAESDESLSVTYNHTTASTPNNAIAICADVYYGGTPTATYAGVNVPLAASQRATSGNTNYGVYLFYATGVATGANNVIVSAGGIAYFISFAVTFTGVSGTGGNTPDNTATNSGTGTSLTISITPVASNAMAVDCGGTEVSSGLTPTGSWTTGQSKVGTSAFSIGSNYIGPVSSGQSDSFSGGSPAWETTALTMAPAVSSSYTPLTQDSIRGGKVTIQGGRVSVQ